jgi:replicative DNA helicase
VNWLNNYYLKYKQVPSDKEIRYGITDNDLLDKLMDYNEVDLRYVADVAIDFAKIQAMKIAILESVDDIKKGDLDKPLTRIEEARKVGMDLLELGYELIQDKQHWMYDQLHGKKYPTGWVQIDNMLDGGVMVGEYALIMAATGKGKTTGLINIGHSWAGLLCKCNVLHVAYEGMASAVLKRYAARVTGVRLRRDEEFVDKERDYELLLDKKASQVYRGRIRVVKPQNKTVDGLKMLVDNLASSGFITQALIADYPDLMKPTRKRNEVRFELGDITRELLDFGDSYGIPVCGATQAGRQALTKEVVTLNDISEAIEKAQVASVVISICQTKEEAEMGLGRLFLAKARDAGAHAPFPVTIDFERQLIVCRNAD